MILLGSDLIFCLWLLIFFAPFDTISSWDIGRGAYAHLVHFLVFIGFDFLYVAIEFARSHGHHFFIGYSRLSDALLLALFATGEASPGCQTHF